MPHGQFKIEWQDSGKEPKAKPDPRYPKGKHLGMASLLKPWCMTGLPYPAKRIGSYIITCKTCGLRVSCTTAGRPDDPKSITVNCKERGH